MTSYIAVDIGASSGRIILSDSNQGKIAMKEVYRFKNGFLAKEGHDRWNIDQLLKEILFGLQIVKQEHQVNECYLGIDTWAVDYCLLDETGALLSQPIAYRDSRTSTVLEKFQQHMTIQELYQRTGIQLQPFNTVFQLFVEEKEQLEKTKKIALIPDYLGFKLTGNLVTEKTNASTTQLLNTKTNTWDLKLLEFIHIDTSYFAPLVDAGNILGKLDPLLFQAYDLPDTTVITVATHDTASALIGTPGQGENWAYISSGTWSLLGIETEKANVSMKALSGNYTNEWGVHHSIRFLKNIMGMWLIQEIARNQQYNYSYSELVQLAKKEPAFQQFIDINDPRFLNPKNMIEEIQTYCEETKQCVPETAGQLARCIYDNLALCYAYELKKLMAETDRFVDTLHIVGGGSNNHFLNQLTANTTQVTVEAGPAEATAIGNLLLQMIVTGKFETIQEARLAIKQSFDYQIFEPQAFDLAILDNYMAFIER